MMPFDSAMIMDNMDEAILIFKLEETNSDHSLRLVYHNIAAEKILNINRLSNDSRYITDVLPKHFTPRLQKIYADVIRTGNSISNHDLPGGLEFDDAMYSQKVFPVDNECVCIIFSNESRRFSAELKLEESREDYSLLFSQMSDAFVLYELIFDSEGNPVDCSFVDINPAFEEMFDVSRKELFSAESGYLTELKRLLWFDVYNDVALTGEYINFSTYSQEFNKYFEITAYCPRKHNVACIIKDVTKSHESEKALQAVIRSSIETEGQGFFDTVSESLANWLKADSVLIGKINESMQFETLSDYTDGSFGPNRVLNQQEFPCTIEMGRDLYIVTGNVSDMYNDSPVLTELDAESLCGLLLKSKGKILGFICCIFRRKYEPDYNTISVLKSIAAKSVLEIERQIVEAKLTENQKRFQSIMDNAQALVCILDLENRYVLVNRQYERILGVRSQFIIGEKINDILGNKSAERYIRESTLVLEEDQAHTFGEYITGKDGKDRYLISTVFPLKDAEDKTYAVCSIMLDQTSQKQGEMDRVQLEKQLIQAQKMESIGRLAGGIAHDFNNILTGILGYAEMLQIYLPKKETKESIAVGYIMKGAERAANLTKQLLGFAREGKYNPVSLNINQVIQETVRVSEKIFDKNINISFQFDPDIDPVMADRNQMEQIFTNLLINAKDAMPSGGDLVLSTENVYLDNRQIMSSEKIKSGDYVRISVKDTGIGIPQNLKNKIFEPFFTTKDVNKGTGLGLATVYGIVKNHNGYVFVDSTPGTGAEFILCFPVYVAEDTVEELDQADVYSGSSTILVIDDEEIVRSTALKMLQKLGYRVILAEDGRTAVDIYSARQSEIDLVLLDFIMPGIDGAETKRLLEEINPDVRIVLASGYSTRGRMENILMSGDVLFIQKPFRLHSLSKIVHEALLDHV